MLLGSTGAGLPAKDSCTLLTGHLTYITYVAVPLLAYAGHIGYFHTEGVQTAEERLSE